MVTHLTSGPLPLARSGLGWGSSWAIATSRTLGGVSACVEPGANLFHRDVRSPLHHDPPLTHSS
ncbi:hypothetical protein [Oscillatoria acuminata]|uniref:hypothetical protein n=1 Tax=Oscillatoria acuminata TaxID=118323 RepID=UPI001E362A95|nr:hypothetical protein [Oscillatoria acuminata]